MTDTLRYRESYNRYPGSYNGAATYFTWDETMFTEGNLLACSLDLFGLAPPNRQKWGRRFRSPRRPSTRATARMIGCCTLCRRCRAGG